LKEQLIFATKKSFFNEYPYGLSEIAIPFLYALLQENGELTTPPNETKIENIEADLYGLMHCLLKKANSYFENPFNFVNIVKSTVQKLDNELYEHLESKKVPYSTISHKLLLTLNFNLIQKVPLITLLWDKYILSNSFGSFHAIVCAHIISYFSEKILKLKNEKLIISYIETLDITAWDRREIRALLDSACKIAESEGLYNSTQTTEFPELKIMDVVSLVSPNTQNDSNINKLKSI